MTLFSLPLVMPQLTHYASLGVPAEATAEEIRAAAARNDARLRERGTDKNEISAAHSVALESAEGRAAHDARHPPLALMRLQPTWEPVLEDRATGMTALRRDIEAFLHRSGEPVAYPDDLTRSDFSRDFIYSPILDGRAAG
jgi:hypothetical protein